MKPETGKPQHIGTTVLRQLPRFPDFTTWPARRPINATSFFSSSSQKRADVSFQKTTNFYNLINFYILLSSRQKKNKNLLSTTASFEFA